MHVPFRIKNSLMHTFGFLWLWVIDVAINIVISSKVVMYSAGQPWIKKTSDNHFDVTMGSYDGAETCELVGAYLLHQITTRYGTTFGLYRDDGLGISKDSPRKVELMKRDLCTIFI